MSLPLPLKGNVSRAYAYFFFSAVLCATWFREFVAVAGATGFAPVCDPLLNIGLDAYQIQDDQDRPARHRDRRSRPRH